MQALLHHTADRYYERLNKTDKDQIDEALDALEKEPPEGDITPLTNEPGRFRLADDYWKPVIEPASPKEAAMIDKRVMEYKKDPASFVPRRKRVTR